MAMQTYWGFYITISLGLIAFMGSAKRSRRLASLVLLAFVAVASVNGDGIRDIARQRVTFHEQLKKFQAEQGASQDAAIIKEVLVVAEPPAVWKVVTFHILADLLVVFAIVSLGFWPAEKADEPEAGAARPPVRAGPANPVTPVEH